MTKAFFEEMTGKIAAGNYTTEELSAFLAELESLDENGYRQVFTEIYAKLPGEVQESIDPLFRARLELKLDALHEQQRAQVVQLPRRRYRIRWTAAAALVLLASFAWLLTRKNEKPAVADLSRFQDVQPGHSGAVLHLADGSTVVLDSAGDGTVANQGNIRAVKVNGQLSYVGQNAEVMYNDITTDKGRQWQLKLPDGTKVWLNAASSIQYPLSFTGADRFVEITGEAYFEVVHNASQPFRVKAGNQLIEDVGTAFNVNAYADEPAARTTVVEGTVQIGDAKLSAGQQGVLENGHFAVAPANTEQALGWKQGLFSFEHADINSVMRELSRWYNVEIKFEGKPGNEPFQGEIGRSLTLSQVLKGLEQIHVHFRIEEGKRIVILP